MKFSGRGSTGREHPDHFPSVVADGAPSSGRLLPAPSDSLGSQPLATAKQGSAQNSPSALLVASRGCEVGSAGECPADR